MYYERLLIEPQDDHWIRFSCPNRPSAGRSDTALLELPLGFTEQMILDAVAATGWTRQRLGQWEFQDSKNCRQLATRLNEMLTYFDSPLEPSTDLARIKRHVEEWRTNESQGSGSNELSLWHYACLDLRLREELAESARVLSEVWEQETYHLNIQQIRDTVILKFLQEIQPLSPASTGLMSPSARTPMKAKPNRRRLG